MKAVVAAFNQEKALVGAFSVITNLRMELFQALEEEEDGDGEAAGGGTLGMDTGLAWARAPLYWAKGQESTTALLLSSLHPSCWPVRILITELGAGTSTPPDLPAAASSLTIDFYDLNIMTTFTFVIVSSPSIAIDRG